jgi:hypothetical protein
MNHNIFFILALIFLITLCSAHDDSFYNHMDSFDNEDDNRKTHKHHLKMNYMFGKAF